MIGDAQANRRFNRYRTWKRSCIGHRWQIFGCYRGPCIGHVTPEAMDGGPIAVVKDENIISIDIPNRGLDLKITEEGLQKRLKQWRPPEPKVKKGILAAYSKIAKPTSKGAGFLF